MGYTITDLKEQQDKYVADEAQKILDSMVKRKEITSTLATCDFSGWDRELHRNMSKIVVKLDELGINTSSSVNHGVTDWVFTVK